MLKVRFKIVVVLLFLGVLTLWLIGLPSRLHGPPTFRRIAITNDLTFPRIQPVRGQTLRLFEGKFDPSKLTPILASAETQVEYELIYQFIKYLSEQQPVEFVKLKNGNSLIYSEKNKPTGFSLQPEASTSAAFLLYQKSRSEIPNPLIKIPQEFTSDIAAFDGFLSKVRRGGARSLVPAKVESVGHSVEDSAVMLVFNGSFLGGNSLLVLQPKQDRASMVNGRKSLEKISGFIISPAQETLNSQFILSSSSLVPQNSSTTYFSSSSSKSSLNSSLSPDSSSSSNRSVSSATSTSSSSSLSNSYSSSSLSNSSSSNSSSSCTNQSDCAAVADARKICRCFGLITSYPPEQCTFFGCHADWICPIIDPPPGPGTSLVRCQQGCADQGIVRSWYEVDNPSGGLHSCFFCEEVKCS